MGSAPKGSTYVELEKGTPLIAGAADYGDVYPKPKKSTTEPTKLCAKGDLIICVRATIGDLNWADKEYCLGRGVAGLRSNEEKLNSIYLYYFIKAFEHELYRQSTGSTFLQINKKVIEGLQIPLPPLPVQKQIAAALEKADTLRGQCKQMEQELNILAQSVFMDMFGDYRQADRRGFLPLGECANVCSGVTKGQKFNDKKTLIAPYMRVANVQDGYLDLKVIKEIEAKVTDFEKYLLKPGDILMTEGGDHDKLGRGAVWEGQIEGCIHQNHVFRVRLDSRYIPKYFEYLLQSQYAKQYFLRCAKKTTNLASINITQLKLLPMPNVSIELQQKFVDFIMSLDKQKTLTKASYKQLNDNFNSLMQRAFKGELSFKDVV